MGPPSLKAEVLKLSREKDNLLRIGLLLEACNILLRELFDYMLPPNMFAGVLCLPCVNRDLQWLKKNEVKLVYPSGKHVTSASFDTSLLVKLLRRMFFTDPELQPVGGWDELPTNVHQNVVDDIVRISFYRNTYAHASYREINNDVFSDVWEVIKGAMVRIAEWLPEGSKSWELTIDALVSGPLTFGEKEYEEKLKKLGNDKEAKKTVQELKASKEAQLKGMFNFFSA